MSRKRMFNFGRPYLLTDIGRGRVFDKEPAICVGKKDSDMERPTLCAVCGEPLGSTGYYSFFLMGPNGRGKDMMIGTGCIKNRIKYEEIDIKGSSFKDTWERTLIEFPNSGRWYGTFLHNCIAKPYVKNRNVAERWDESILRLPGVRYIMEIIDDLRKDGWNLDAELILDSGGVDLLATHPDGRAIVFDWKSDRCFDNHESYLEQVNRYMSELNRAGMQNITGYIIWIMEERKEPVLFKGVSEISDIRPRSYVPSPQIMCSLNIDMNGGEPIIRRKRVTESSHHRLYGDEVFFYIPPCEPERNGYEFSYFEASPYREGELPQTFTSTVVVDGLPLTCICSKKRHSFILKANWKRIRPFKCYLDVYDINHNNPYFRISSESKIDEEGNDFVEFEVSEILRHLNGKVLDHAKLGNNEAFTGIGTEWNSDELHEGTKIRIPCPDDSCDFTLIVRTRSATRSLSDNKKTASVKKKKNKHKNRSSDIFERDSSNLSPMFETSSLLEILDVECDPILESIINSTAQEMVSPQHSFTPGHIYVSGGRYHGIFKRMGSERHNTFGVVHVAEVDIHRKQMSKMERRYIYRTRGGKEYIYGLFDHRWKIYTDKVFLDTSTEVVEN